MRLAAPLAIALVACAPAADDPTRPSGGRLVRVVTWNVHDLFDAEDRVAAPGALDTVPSPAEVDAKLDAIASVLARLDAEVVLLQEVETLALAEALAARAGYPQALLVEGNDPRGIDVAALSRLPVIAYVSHAREPDAGGVLWPRDCAELHVDAAGRRLVAVVTHLSSALSDDGTRRARQAARLRAIADGLAASGAAVAAGGDLNDEPSSPALAPLLADDAWRDADAGLAPADSWTWSDGSRRRALDHLLVPAAGPLAVLRTEVATGADVTAASDHRPVVVDLWIE
jgi:endonuclease/exonuclease/phosphatase family metal-dependent hydrolase